MKSEILKDWEDRLVDFLSQYQATDAAHDLGHFKRVWKIAREIAAQEQDVDMLVLLAACYLHDFESLPKNHPNRSKASHHSATRVVEELKKMGFPEEKLIAVFHAVEAHSFSAGVTPTTIEAKILQDSDRLEVMGAIGIARVFAVSGSLGTSPFHPTDPLAKSRPLDDQKYAVDHFFKKLFIVQNTLNTRGGREIGEGRAKYMRGYIDQLMSEIS